VHHSLSNWNNWNNSIVAVAVVVVVVARSAVVRWISFVRGAFAVVGPRP